MPQLSPLSPSQRYERRALRLSQNVRSLWQSTLITSQNVNKSTKLLPPFPRIACCGCGWHPFDDDDDDDNVAASGPAQPRRSLWCSAGVSLTKGTACCSCPTAGPGNVASSKWMQATWAAYLQSGAMILYSAPVSASALCSSTAIDENKTLKLHTAEL